MNDDFGTVENVLLLLRDLYAARCDSDAKDPAIPITERDIVADLRHSLMEFCSAQGYHVHCEVKPADNEEIGPEEMRRLPRIDVVILRDDKKASWFTAAKKLQGKYSKGSIEARFSSVPVKYFHTAIEAKIQSKVDNAIDDIDTLKDIEKKNPSCNCFFILLNARGKVRDHDNILAYAQEKKVRAIEYTAQR